MNKIEIIGFMLLLLVLSALISCVGLDGVNALALSGPGLANRDLPR